MIEVAAGLVFREGRLLLAQRYPDDPLGGLWEFPGGKRHPGEAFEACLRRELAEELGIEVDVGSLVEAVTHDYPERRVHLRFFHCRWVRHEPRPIGCQAFAWVTREAMETYDFPPADAGLLKRLRGETAWWG